MDLLGPGHRYNVGTVAFDVPACAVGSYTISFRPEQTLESFLGNNALPPGIIPLSELVSATITITNCATNSDCNDLNLCTADICSSQKVCTNPPKSTWNPQTQCCHPLTGATALIPATLLCHDISCSLGGSEGSLVLVQHAEGTACDLGDPCTGSESCSASGSCVGVEFPGPACQKSRFITLDPANIGGASALRVTLTSLHHVDPPYPIPPMNGDFTAFEGERRWVGPATDCVNFVALGTTYKCATLQCTPHYANWTAVLGGEFLHVTGAAVVPSSSYDVAQISDACMGVEASCASVVPEPSVATGRWGDLTSPYQTPAASSSGQPNGIDVVVMVDVVKGRPESRVSRPRGLLAGTNVNPNAAPTVTEITLLIDGIKGLGFPYAGPSPCNP